MKLTDLLKEDRIAVPLAASDAEAAIRALAGLLRAAGTLDAQSEERLVQELLTGKGELVRVADDVALLIARCDGLEELAAVLGVAAEPIVFTQDPARPVSARAIVILLAPRRLEVLKERLVPTLLRVLREDGRSARLLAAASAAEVRAIKELMDVELHERLLVQDALIPLRYRIYPDTPLLEIVDLMVRRGLRAVPVVGESYEVLGIITAGDALRHLIPRTRGGDEAAKAADAPRGLSARDVMTRAVMCVSEDQSLLEAANLMINRDVEQLPVVREGELIGFLTRDAVLRMLFASSAAGLDA